jgi:hypothetical protein
MKKSISIGKRTIEIGDRAMSDMSEQEISDLLYHFGYSASKQFWHPPVVTIYDRVVSRKDNQVWFEWTTTRKSDGLKHEHKGWIEIGNSITKNAYHARIVVVKHKDDNDIKGSDLPIQALAWLISKGFDIPIYTDQKSYYPVFQEY